jgi:hypothetical protein
MPSSIPPFLWWRWRGRGLLGSRQTINVTVVKENPLLARAGVYAKQTWRYQPARRDGFPVKTESSMVFAFEPN